MTLLYKLTYKIKVFMAELPVCKILRKFVHTTLILLGTALAGWIYWKRSAEFKPTPINWDLVINVSLQPFPTPCKSNTMLVIIVTSYVGHAEHRKAHRTFTPEVELWKINATRVFLLGQIPKNEKKITQSAINDESTTFGDILQGPFIDNYRNLTYKHLMGLKWASTTCQDASFILKVDDDTVYHLDRTYALLNSISNTTNLLLGYRDLNSVTVRYASKWYVTWEEWPRKEFPTYVFGGYYITTPRVAAALCDEAIYHPFFWIDDVFVTGILTEALGIKITPGEYILDNIRYKNCQCCSKIFPGFKDFNCRHPK